MKTIRYKGELYRRVDADQLATIEKELKANAVYSEMAIDEIHTGLNKLLGCVSKIVNHAAFVPGQYPEVHKLDEVAKEFKKLTYKAEELVESWVNKVHHYN